MVATDLQDSPLNVLAPLHLRYGAKCSLEEFHQAINVVFHDMEASEYDQVHQCMWESLPKQFALLAGDILAEQPAANLRLLDIGSGTGLSTALMLESPLGERIVSVHLLDTSAAMLEKAKAKVSQYPVAIETTHGPCESLRMDSQFDIIMTSSVLHHIPDLDGFGSEISRLQTADGFFVHLQDPNAGSIDSEARIARNAEWKKRREASRLASTQGWSPQRIAAALWRRLTGKRQTNYIDHTNQELIARRIITHPMTPNDLWAVTDIHDNVGDGISVSTLQKSLISYRAVSVRSYAFFSVLESELPPDLQTQERALIESGALDGCYLSAVWRKFGNESQK